MAQFAIDDNDGALDIVQDAMFDFVRRYGNKPADEWLPLFYRVLQSRITDAHRRRTVRSRIWSWFGREQPESGESDPIQEVRDPHGSTPLDHLERSALDGALKNSIAALPLRQQQAFLLRTWEGLDLADTATAMGCSTGSVKTHYFRAVQALRKQLEEFSP